MNINTSNIIRQIAEHFDSKANTLNIRNIYEIKKEADYNSLLRNLTSDKKFTIISEKNDDNNNHHNELRFQENTPIARPLESSNIFNETRKVANKKPRKNFYNFYNQEEKTQFIQESNNEKGFYIIIDGMIFQPESNKKELSYIQKRINKVYNIKFAKDPGTLVNVIA